MIFPILQSDIRKGKRKRHQLKRSTQSFCKDALETPFKISCAELTKKQENYPVTTEIIIIFRYYFLYNKKNNIFFEVMKCVCDKGGGVVVVAYCHVDGKLCYPKILMLKYKRKV